MGRIDPGSPYRIQELPDGDVILSILPPTSDENLTDAQAATRVLMRRELRMR